MNEKITSKIWKDSDHIRRTEYSAEIKNVKAYLSYHQNPKQAFRSRMHNGKCKVYNKAEIQAFEMNLKNN